MLPLAVGAATGVLSGFGVGGGTLLLVYMTAFAGLDQRLAQGINLLYFLPTAGMGLIWHRKNGLLEKDVLRQAIPLGTVAAIAAAWIATSVDTAVFRKPFGVYLLLTGVMTLFQTKKSSK